VERSFVWCSSEVLLHGLCNVGYISLALVELGVVLHYQEGWGFSSRIVLSWRDVKALLTISSMELRSSSRDCYLIRLSGSSDSKRQIR
jgi:hypothetical protein